MMFAVRMAWRDFRAKPSRFLFYLIAIALGVGSLSAIESFRLQLHTTIDAQGRNLLGADLQLRSRRPFTPEQEKLLADWNGKSARSISYRTLLLNPESGGTRLVEVEAAEKGFPFYGELGTEPAGAGRSYEDAGQVLLDQSLILQLDIKTGMTVKIGGQPFVVAGAVLQSPGEVPARSMITPKVYVPLRLVDEERMKSPGTMAKFEWYGALPDDAAANTEVAAYVARARAVGFDVETVTSRREQLMGQTDRIGRYLGLMGFTALMIGCLGVAGAVHFFISSKRQFVAQLRCMGATLFQASGLFFIQLLLLAVLGATAGLGVGWAMTYWLPQLVSAFLPVPVAGAMRMDAAVSTWLVGVAFTLLAGLIPITRLRHVRPLASLRIDDQPSRVRLDLYGAAACVLLVSLLAWFATRQLNSVKQAMMYLGGVAAVLVMLAVTGMLIRTVCRLAVRPGWSYMMRLAVSGLYRPQNQTALLVASLGLGCFLLNTVDVMEQHVLRDFSMTGKSRPNLAMIDIQRDQREPLLQQLARYQTSVTYVEPMITMRLVKINGLTIPQLEKQPGPPRPNWALKREYRTTYRAHMKPEIEKIVSGLWFDQAGVATSTIPISLEKSIAEALQVQLGDTITYDVHGVEFTAMVSNVREVDWKSMQPNFFVIFPPGVLEEAPQTFLVFSQMDDERQRADFQRDVATKFPNVTVIDISLMMDTVAAMTAQLSVAVRAIAWMTLAAGFMVLLAILRAGRHQRLREGILLRTLGAPQSLITGCQVIEYAIVALAAIFSGLLLSWVTSGFVVHFAMELSYQPDWTSPWPTMGILLTVTLLLGWLNARSATRQLPSDAWRTLSMSAS